jgi:hypothetical protein
MSENGLEIEETQTTDVSQVSQDGTRTETRSAGDERLFAWRANYVGRRESPLKKLAGVGLWLGAAGVAGVLSALILSPGSDSEAAPRQASLLPSQNVPAVQAVEEIPLTPMAQAEATTYDPHIVSDTVKLWQLGGHAWVQFDYESEVPIYLHWFDAEGRSSLNPIECKDRLGDGMRRCYFGRSYGRINLSLSRGYTPGEWSVFACKDYEGTECKKVGDWDIQDPMVARTSE